MDRGRRGRAPGSPEQRRRICSARAALAGLVALAGLAVPPGRARADIVPPQRAEALAAQQAADEKKLKTCSPRREEEYGRFGRTVIHRQVDYDVLIGSAVADSSDLRLTAASWMRDRRAALRACMPEPAQLVAPERIVATVHLLLQRQVVRSVVVVSAEPGPGANPPRPRMDTKCIEKALLERPELVLKAPAATARVSIQLAYAAFCAVWREYEREPPASSVGYGSGIQRHLMPEPPRPGAK